mmetsp:Transcript_26180/g.34909  ORF Transcript_26180/g.34909 Transcript_26180/m.34909 type:complete len:137 (+) Transcript_26180:824-1234(+)
MQMEKSTVSVACIPEVASSNSKIRGLRTRALAIAIRCFCPPLSCTPRSPTSVSYPNGRPSMKDDALANLAASSISFIDGSYSVPSSPYIIFLRTDLANNVGSWETTVTCRLSHSGLKSCTLLPSMQTSPFDGSYKC